MARSCILATIGKNTPVKLLGREHDGDGFTVRPVDWYVHVAIVKDGSTRTRSCNLSVPIISKKEQKCWFTTVERPHSRGFSILLRMSVDTSLQTTGPDRHDYKVTPG